MSGSLTAVSDGAIVSSPRRFASYDNDANNVLDEAEMRTLLTAVKKEFTNDASASVDDTAFNYVWNKYVSKSGENVLGVERARILQAVKGMKAYISKDLHYQELFAKHDKDGSGTLTKDELLPLLREVAPPPHKHADEGDTAFVLQHCDADGSGLIEKAELWPAVSMWIDVAKEVPPDGLEFVSKPAARSTSCALL